MSTPTVTNIHDIPLEMAVWLLHDEYDYVTGVPNYISATGLLKPVRHIVLPPRIHEEDKIVPDVCDYIATSLGTALHAGIEKAWLNKDNVMRALIRLGYPKDLAARVLVNPTPKELSEVTDAIAVYLEQRQMKTIEVDGETFTIGGKFDLVCDGRVTDTKSGSVYGWIFNDRNEDYKLQGSIYRWLNPSKITEDFIRINHIFTDWQAMAAKTQKNYPPRRIMHTDIMLLSVEETELWIKDKLRAVIANRNKPEPEVLECTEEELWLTAPKYRYYSDPAKAQDPNARSTRNFDDLGEANAFMNEKGKGIVVASPRVAKRCGYCPAFPICTQKDRYNHD